MSYDYRAKRTVILLSGTLAPGVALNVVGHLAIALGRTADDDLMGRPTLVDASGVDHRGISKYAVIIKKATTAQVGDAVRQGRALSDLLVADYPNEMLTTGHDDELADAIAKMKEEDLEYLGALFYGPTPSVDQVCRKYPLWK